MTMRLKFLGMGLCLMALLGVAPAMAAPTGYTDETAFLGAAVGTKQVTNIDSATPGDAFAGAPGFTVGAMSLVPVSPYVQTGQPTTSGKNYLGLAGDNGNNGLFYNGDTLTFALDASVRAFGLYVISGVDATTNDFALSFSNGSVFSLMADRSDLGAGSYAFFLGLISDSAFGDITLNFGDGMGLFAAAVDDVTLFGSGDNGGGGGGDVPEPGTLALIGLAVLAAGVARRRQAPSATSFNPGSMA
jgi:hypothetical protein